MLIRRSIFSSSSVCSGCLRRLSIQTPIGRRNGSTASPIQAILAEDYFWANTALRDIRIRQKRWQTTTKRVASESNARAGREPSASAAAEVVSPSAAKEAAIPPDASSRLTTLSTSLPKRSLKRRLAVYLSLSKPRLTFLIVLTTTAAYSIYPVPSLLSPDATAAPSLSTITLLFLTSGTFLTSSSANAFNMLLEPEHDAKMSRTRNRPLVRNLISKRAALLFAIGTGILGTGALYYGVNPTTAALGAGNILLYAGVYTPLKRIHPLNTWVGAVVGAIPPLMGWAAAGGLFASQSGDWRELLFGENSRGGWALAGLLFAWQIPHFAALSFSIRHEYAAAGYKMLCSSKPRLDAVYSLLCATACSWTTVELYNANVIEQWAALATVPLNIWFILRAVQFRALEGAKSSARNLFWASVWYLPGVLVVCMIGKKGLLDGTWAWISGKGRADDDEEWDWEEDAQRKSLPISKA